MRQNRRVSRVFVLLCKLVGVAVDQPPFAVLEPEGLGDAQFHDRQRARSRQSRP